MDVFILHTKDRNFLYNVAIDDQLFIDENGNYWYAVNHADEDELKFNGHLLKKVAKDHILSTEIVL